MSPIDFRDDEIYDEELESRDILPNDSDNDNICDNDKIYTARQRVKEMLNNPDPSLKYENRRNWKEWDLGMSENEIENEINEEMENLTDFGYEKNSIWILYKASHLLLTKMERMILNTRDIPWRAIDTTDKNKIMELRRNLTIKYNNMNEIERFTKIKNNNEKKKMINDLNRAENETLKYFQNLMAITIMEDVTNYYDLQDICITDNKWCLTFNKKPKGYDFKSFESTLFWDVIRHEKYLENDFGEETGVESYQMIDRKYEKYIIDYSWADRSTKNEIKKNLWCNNEECFKWILYKNSNWNIIYAYPIDSQKNKINIMNKILPIGPWVTIQELWWYNNQKNQEEMENEKFENATLDKEDFEKDFKGDFFRQRNIGNCWQLSTIDSFINFWDYEELIRHNVKKNNEWWYDIRLPMSYPPKNKTGLLYSIKKEDLLPQVTLTWNELNLVKTTEKGIHCLVVALAQRLVSVGVNFDFNSMSWGWWCNLTKQLLNENDFNITTLTRESTDFETKLKSYLMGFNRKTDIMTVSVYRPESRKREDIKPAEKKEWVAHEISLERTYIKDDTRYVVLSNPHNASLGKIIPLNDFLTLCKDFSFTTKNYYKKIEEGDNIIDKREPPEEAKNDSLTLNWYYCKNPEKWLNENESKSINEKRNLDIRLWFMTYDWTISDAYDDNCYAIYLVNSFNQKTTLNGYIDDNDTSCFILSIDNKDLILPKSIFSSEYTNKFNEFVKIMWKMFDSLWITRPSTFPEEKDSSDEIRYWSAMALANFINYVKYKKSNDWLWKFEKTKDNKLKLPWKKQATWSTIQTNICTWWDIGLNDEADNYVNEIVNFLNSM